MTSQAWETITPEKAKEYLAQNKNNPRGLSRAKAEQYAKDMAAGKWQENGEPIVFDEDGILKDGQHRLMAIVIARKPIKTMVIRGVSRDITIFDFGATRTVTQMLHTTSCIAGAARVICGNFNNAAPRGIVADYIIAHEDELKKAERLATYGNRHGVGRKAAITLTVYIVRRLHIATDDQLEEFFWIYNNQCTRPNQLRDPSPALIAARTMVTKYGNGSSNIQPKQISITMQAIQDFRRNKPRMKEYKPENLDVNSFLDTIREMDGIK